MKAKVDARKRIESARKSFKAGDYTRALEEIDEVLRLDESNTEALSLREQVAAAHQREAAAFAADAVRRATAEPDLNRQVEILQAAAARCPDDQHLHVLLVLQESKRDVIGSLWARARYFDFKHQFDQALAELRTIQTVYPECPGLAEQVALIERHKLHPEEAPAPPPVRKAAVAAAAVGQSPVAYAPAQATQPPPPPVAQPSQPVKPAEPPKAPVTGAKPKRNLLLVGIAGAIVIVAVGGYLMTRNKAVTPAPSQTASPAPQPAAPVALTPVIRIDTNLPGGDFALDGQSMQPLESGLARVEVQPGTHRIRLVSPKYGESTLQIEVAPGKPPQVTRNLPGKDVASYAIGSYDNTAQLTATVPNLPVRTEAGDALGKTGAEPVAITGAVGSTQRIVLGQGEQQWTADAVFESRPSFTWFLRVNVTTGGVVVKADQDDVIVRIDGKTQAGKLKSGELRPFRGLNPGPHEIRVEKFGYKVEPPFRRLTVVKGKEEHAEFSLIALSSIELKGAKNPGARVFVNNQDLGAIGPDGNARISGIDPGNCRIELRLPRFLHKAVDRQCKPGETLSLAGDDLKMVPTGFAKWDKVNPSNIRIVAIKDGEERLVSGLQIELPAGKYTFKATAPGYKPHQPAEGIEIRPGVATLMGDWVLEPEK